MQRNKLLICVTYPVIFLLLFFLYLHISYHTGYNSDSASEILEANEMAKGNWLLKDWVLSTVNFYFTDAIWYAALIKIFGYNHDYIYIIPSFGYTIASLVLAKLSYKYTHSKAATFIASLFFIIPSKFVGDTITLPAFHGMSVLFFIISLAFFIEATQKNIKLFYIYIPLTTLLLFSDDIVKYWLIIPSIFSAIYIYTNNKTIKNKNILLLSIAPIAPYIILRLIMKKLGFAHIPGMQASFVDLSQIKDNVYWFFENIFAIFNSNFFGKKLSIKEAAKPLINFSALCAMIYAFYDIAKKKEKSHFTLLLLFSTIVICFSFLISGVSKSEGSARYFLILSFVFPLIWAKSFSLTPSSKTKSIYLAIACLAFLSTVHSVKMKGSPLKTWEQTLSTLLEQHNLKAGYSNFWNAANTTINEKVTLRQIYLDDNEKIRAKHWLSNNKWYDDYANFIICDESLCNENSDKYLKNQFGEIKERINIGKDVIYVWDHDISPYIIK